MDLNSYRVTNYKFNKDITQKLNFLSKLDNYHTPIALLYDWLIIITSIFFTEKFFYLYPFALLIIGSRQRALSTIFHDAAHGRAAKNKLLNTLAGTLFSSFWLFQSMNQYKLSHVKFHHGNLGNDNIDPDYKYYIDEGLYCPSLNAKKFLMNHVIKNTMLLKSPSYLYYIIKNRFSSAMSFPIEFSLMIAAWIIVISTAYHLNNLHVILLFWLIPYITTHAIIGYFIEISEHYPLLGKSNKMLYLARNRFSHWLEAFIFSIHYENYHLVHHLRPNVPFWNMQKAHKIMLQDEKYAEVNRNFGGVFISSNAVKPLISVLCSQKSNNCVENINTL